MRTTNIKYFTGKRKTQKKFSPTRRGKYRWVLGIILAVIIFIFFYGSHSIPKMVSLLRERSRLKEEKIRLEQTNRNLEEEIKQLKTSDEYVEKIARERHNMKKEGEEVYKVKPQ